MAAGLFELKDALGRAASASGRPLVATLVSFVVAYASVAWLLRFVAGNSIAKFVPYRVGLGVLLLVALGAGWMTAT